MSAKQTANLECFQRNSSSAFSLSFSPTIHRLAVAVLIKMTTPTKLGQPSGGCIQPPSPKVDPTVSQTGNKESLEETQTRWSREAQEHFRIIECTPIKGACGCKFTPCHLGGSTVLPYLPEPHFTTMMRNAIKEHPFRHPKHAFEVHRMLGIDPTPQKTADEVRSVAHIPWLLQNRFSTLPNRLESIIRRAIKDDTKLTELDRQMCYRMMAMDAEAVAERERVGDCQTCPACGTPKEYRLDGCSWLSPDKWGERPSYYPERYEGHQDRKTGSRHQMPPRQPRDAVPTVVRPPQQLNALFGPRSPLHDRDGLSSEADRDEDWDF